MLAAELGGKHIQAAAQQDVDALKARWALMVTALSDVRVQLSDAMALPKSAPKDVESALAKALAWLGKEIDGEVWGTMRLLADEVVRLRPYEISGTMMAERERVFAETSERVMRGMDVEIAALNKAKVDNAAEVTRLTEGLRRIAKEYDFSAAGKAALALLGGKL